MKESKGMRDKAKKLLQFLANPRLILCFGMAWIITNGWSYIFMGIGTYYDIGWMVAMAGAYLTFLWLPISPEKILTFAISIVLMKWLFPKDEKTLGVLKALRDKARAKHREKADARQNEE